MHCITLSAPPGTVWRDRRPHPPPKEGSPLHTAVGLKDQGNRAATAHKRTDTDRDLGTAFPTAHSHLLTKVCSTPILQMRK